MPVLNALDTPLEKSEEPLEREVIDAELQRLLETKPAQMSYDEYLKWYVAVKNIQRFYRSPVIEPLMFIDGFTEEDLEKAVGGKTTVNFMVFICHGHYKWMVIVYCSQAEPALDGLVIIYCSDIDMVICGGNSVFVFYEWMVFSFVVEC
ncbi:hypothetical protein Pmar_PMAR004538 [Perkinsus marinus ATCC 50983]|uniref:Uncharacterized protein n=1 Tax=Perkinsus marinus (strain ATCC 50983 / TXsc) TaxID=423536 RepID=C5LZY0_PERM5|nr:hypothetical protein Pmar_PMAR004538 [Perkinsus marinus ATCC 50983]EEQ97798.1 hypothetical protein Pmar_PMAR004538 [Perkinsus marinus ATCC 50983]|eukprot:XP_002765081.1 hypothetical protein Pmar_PMAR004538 [Perkinsus marinus ATCC 50983]